MDSRTLNPLAKHFRQPSIYFKLPSGGQFWKEGSLELPMVGEIPVFPMTARDEISLRTPDALLNGQGVVDVIQSCIPAIKNAWDMPSVDVDASLIAIRIASYGQRMDITTKCPHCNEEHEYGVDLSMLLGSIRCPAFHKKVDAGGVKVKIKPQNYFSSNQTDQIRFEEQRIVQSLSNEAVPEDVRLAEFSKHLQKIVDLNIKMLVDSTEFIETDDGTVVTEKNYITEFYNNCETGTVQSVQDKLQELAKEADFDPMTSACTACQKEFLIPLAFDYSRFFAKGS